eukprot:622724-Pyramimonas_sp.AAC.2
MALGFRRLSASGDASSAQGGWLPRMLKGVSQSLGRAHLIALLAADTVRAKAWGPRSDSSCSCMGNARP